MTQTVEQVDVAAEVVASRARIRAVDPHAYSGFVTDKAVLAVAKRTGLNWREVLKAYRAERPGNAKREIPPFAQRVSDGGRAVA